MCLQSTGTTCDLSTGTNNDLKTQTVKQESQTLEAYIIATVSLPRQAKLRFKNFQQNKG